ncbi:MAG TPA: hypothetical protein VFB66_08105 [Tepidisphaeraceae bacterium]|nr:hypothetical protein [Tepidisphaeraceae bacterium]
MSGHDANQHDAKKTLSEISHLFLSSIRERQTDGAAKPRRTPPTAQQTPRQPAPRAVARDNDPAADEFARGCGDGVAASGPGLSQDNGAAEAAPRRAGTAPVCAVIASHLNGKQFDRVKEYARHLAGRVGRIGLIELDASEFRLMCFEPGGASAFGGDEAESDEYPAETYDPRQIAEAIEEMGCDVDRWVLLLTTPRVPEAKALLRKVDHWVLLTTCDHDGVVSSYRTLKGLAEPNHPPKLTLALLDGGSEAEMVSVFRKLAGVCEQFLGLHLDPEPAVRPSFRIAEHLVLCCRPTRDKAQMANPPQWDIVADFLDRSRGNTEGVREVNTTDVEPDVEATVTGDQDRFDLEAAPVQSAAPVLPAAPTAPFTAAAEASAPLPANSTVNEVIDLPADDNTSEAVLSAVLRQNGGTYVECPVRAPMCGSARVAVGRDRSVVLFAVAREGLGELRAIGQAYRWLSENRSLLGMALPQFAIDTRQSPRLRLLVDQSDVSAAALQPVLQSDHVTVHSYRKIRWGGRTGLLLDAA